uniref:Uncharacterized protein n=1 Tax=Quercus lobata TaxID=97700 RepID=A0A7N2MZ55_QUELO
MANNAVTFLLANLTQLLIQESKLQGGVEDQVRLLQNELRMISVFLQNIEDKRHDNVLVKEVVSQIRDVAYEAEDVIDTFIMTLTKQRRRNKVRNTIHFFDRASTLHEVANKIERIKNVIKEIYENRSKYGVEIAESSGGDAEAEEILHRRRRHVEEDQVVDFAHDTEALMKQLIEGSLRRNVVSIIGMGGLEYRIRELLLEILKGLTPLPRMMLKADLKEELLNNLEALYSSNKDELKGTLIENLKHIKEMNDEEFRKAWSKFLAGIKEQHCDLKILLSGFMQDFYKKNGVKLKDMSDDELKSVLLESLEDKRYLLVMDDIWKTNVWNEVSTAFPNNSNGSRILITSRIKEVALHATTINNSVPPIPPYELPFLNKDKSWELFSKKVFWEGTCPPEL